MTTGANAQKHAAAWAEQEWVGYPIHVVKQARVKTPRGYINTGEDIWGVADILVLADPIVILQVTTWGSHNSQYAKRRSLARWIKDHPRLHHVPMRLGVIAYEKRKCLHCSWWTGEDWTPWCPEQSPLTSAGRKRQRTARPLEDSAASEG